MEDSVRLRVALEVAQDQLAAAEAELLDARRRVHHLRAAVYSLRELLTEEAIDPGQGELFRSQEPERLPPVRVEERAMAVESSGATRSTQADTPIGRAVAVLADAGKPLRMREIQREWQQRDWIDPRWRTPASAINMVYQRALRAGKVGRMADGSWVLPMAVQDELARKRHGFVHGLGDRDGAERE